MTYGAGIHKQQRNIHPLAHGISWHQWRVESIAKQPHVRAADGESGTKWRTRAIAGAPPVPVDRVAELA